jgi:hypothetical protein
LVPDEKAEQKAVVRWLRLLNYTPMAIENEQTIQPRQSADRWKIAQHRKSMGREKGAPDFLIVEPSAAGLKVVVEMKKRKGGRVKAHQEAVHQKMWDNGWVVVVGYGFEDAKAKLEGLGYGKR